MVDSGVYPSDGESRAPRKHKSEQSTNHINTRSSHYSAQNGYTSERTPNRSHHERSQNRHQERDEYRGDRRQNRHQKDRSQVQHPEREKHYGDREQNRSRDEYKERDKSYNDRGHSRHEADRSRNRYEEKDIYYKQSLPSGYEERNNHHKERSRNQFDERERHEERYVQSVDHHGLSVNKKHTEHYSSERSLPQNGAELLEMEYYEAESEGGILDCHKCKYLCTGRGVLQMLEVILNILVLICVVASHFTLSGFSAGMASGGFGGGYYPFEGQELQEVRQLDQEFTLLRAPLVYGGLTMCLLTGTMTLAILAHGSRRLLDLSKKWLLIEATFSAVASLGYGAAVGVFLHFALQINSTDVCKRRERLYGRNGLTWMNCYLAGTDGGAATFAILLIILYAVSVVLAARAYKEKKALQQ
ncbi:MARVEL domain-containing protein 3 isoform X2 [Hyla sarda]|uniref:MARVEL domain-containing protein 3 isoform X2 n=1 Tax=Hyla sarda TaxID=327740 RepID=UPI0024C21F28|nr:MARVEL domain-containing protein 3 isoform X2 [Hyla sarda]